VHTTRIATALAVAGLVLVALGGAFAVVLSPAPLAKPASRPSSPPASPSSSPPAPQPRSASPDGVPATQVGKLVLNDPAAALWKTWDHTSLGGADCETPGTFALTAGVLGLTTSGAFGNCAKITSPAAYRYGIFEARIWAQAGPGGFVANWPAFWMVGQHWPVDGEIDAFEGLGGYDSATFHYGASNWQLTKRDAALKPGWTVVDVVWKPHLLAVYYNGRKFVEWDSPVITSQPMLVTFDSTTGQGGYTTGQPSTLRIDYLRIWTAAGRR
jgi:Glycosyl hydrolases family 16